MTGGVLGGGVIFVVAGVLWAAVLVPAWMRRREFKVAEQNAVRLQRTLRVLAETAEVPTEVRVEATAREALAQEKLLRTAQRRQESERQAELALARAEQTRAQIEAQRAERLHANLERAAKLRRPWVRRVRGLAALIAICATAAVLIGIGLWVAGQGTVVLFAAGLAFFAATAGLVLLAPGRVKTGETPTVLSAPARPQVPAAQVEPQDQALARDTSAEHAASQAAAAARIAQARALARARAERLPVGEIIAAPGSMLPAPAARANDAIERSLSAAPHSPTERSDVAQVSVRLQSMGVVGDTSDGALKLDAALQRLRNAS